MVPSDKTGEGGESSVAPAVAIKRGSLTKDQKDTISGANCDQSRFRQFNSKASSIFSNK